MNNEYMAQFGPDSFVSNIVSEANAIKYRLIVRGSNTNSSNTRVHASLNGVDLINPNVDRGRGLCMIVLDGTTLSRIDYRSFDVYGFTETNSQAMKDFMTNQPSNRLVLIYSFDAIGSNQVLQDFMVSIGSTAWYSDFLNLSATSTDYRRSSYSAVYNSTMKKIVSENFVAGTVGNLVDSRSLVDIVFDEFSDIGVNGIPERIADDGTLYESNGNYSFHNYASHAIPSNKAKAGNIYRITAELMHDQTVGNLNGSCRLYTFIKNNQNWLGEKVLSTTGLAANQWHKLEAYYQIPIDTAANSFGVESYHFPSSITSQGKCSIRNVSVTQVSKIPSQRGSAMFGVNGIRLERMVEEKPTGTPIDRLLSIPVSESGQNSSKLIESSKFKEYETIFNESIEVAGSSGVSLWNTSRNELSGYGLKTGDTIRLTSEMSRDQTSITSGIHPWFAIGFYDAGGNHIVDTGLYGNTLNQANTFVQFNVDITIPVNATHIIYGYYRRGSGNGSVRFKNSRILGLRE
ncbi:hinge connector of long tail fiber proximal connector [Pectobacterium phage POP12]|nr:hinge connector of long tail fiber proximal connector [Pectobacterium phage POP12]